MTALLLIIIAIPNALAGEAPANDALFESRIYTNRSGATLPFRLLRPEHYDPNKSYAVILYLHGAAARGRDNAEPLQWGPRLFLNEQTRAKHEFFLVVPQCPRESAWLVSSWNVLSAPKESPSLAMALQLVSEELPRQFNLDPARRYLTGVSMGGHAVWGVMIRRPGLFAAAVPVCAGGDARAVTDAAAKYPVWAFHSDDDHLVPVQQARELVRAWRAHGGVAKYTEYTGLRHSSWKKAYLDQEMFDWLFAQKRP